MSGKLLWRLTSRKRYCLSAAALLGCAVFFLLLRFPAISKRIQLLHALLGHLPQYDHLFRQQKIYQKIPAIRFVWKNKSALPLLLLFFCSLCKIERAIFNNASLIKRRCLYNYFKFGKDVGMLLAKVTYYRFVLEQL